MSQVRRLQRLGSTTLVVSLPREWVKRNYLKPGDIVHLQEGSDRISILASRPAQRPSKCTINADELESADVLSKLVTACYLQGYDEVRVVSSRGLSPDQVMEAQSTVERLPGFEIIEQTPRKLVIQSIVDPTRFTMESIVRRMHMMGSSMISAAVDSLVSLMPERAGEVARMESKVDELYFLGVRQLLLSLRDASVAKATGIDSYVTVTGYRVVAKVLEEVGDYALAISREGLSAKRRARAIERELAGRIVGLADEVLTVFGKTVKAFLTLDLKLVNEAFNSIAPLTAKIERAELEVHERVKEPQLAVSIRVALRYLTDILNGCKIIAEITINKFVRQSTRVCWVENA